MTVVTRFPPSPTGYFHIGSARTALFNYLYAAHEGGAMHVRFEDTDRERSKKEFEEDILSGLAWLHIPFDEKAVLRQSERTELYRGHLQRLIENGKAYEAEEAESGGGKKVIRFKNPNTTITFQDIVRGEVSFDTTELKDFVVAKNLAEPLYHLAVVIDDRETGVTHVVRGEDHISNTPRQILILEALGFTRPVYAHIPLILAPDRSKLSKRHGAVSINEYKKEGFIPEAIVNYLALLGWNPGTEQEIFTLRELVEAFDITRVQKGGAVFDIEKLKWFNHEHLKRLSDEAYAARFEAFADSPLSPTLAKLLKERARTLGEARALLDGGEFAFLEDTVSYEPTLLVRGAKIDAATAREHLEKISELLEHCGAFDIGSVKEAVFPYATEKGRGAVLWPLRVALSGREKSPDPFTICSLIGKEKSLARIRAATEALAAL